MNRIVFCVIITVLNINLFGMKRLFPGGSFNEDVISFVIIKKDPNVVRTLQALRELNLGGYIQLVSKPREVMLQKEDKSEEIAFKELSCWKAFDDLANEIGLLPKDDISKLLNCFPKLQKLYQQYNALKDYMQANTSFFFCCGLFAYYLEKENSVDKLKEWFKSNLNMELTKENGIELIKKSSGEHAYFFLQSLGL